MIIEAMSQREAIAYSHKKDILPTAIISIRNTDNGHVEFADNGNIKAILHLNFDDTQEDLPGAITFSDAERIVSFFEQKRDVVESVVIHCAEGISRSAGVAAALMRYVSGDDGDIFEDKAYRPNIRCYRMVLAAINRVRCKDGLWSIYGRRYKGLFWFKSDIEIIPILLPCLTSGEIEPTFPLRTARLSEGGNNYTHVSVWKTLPHYVTEGHLYNYYPRGRVEIKNGTAIIYAHPSLCNNEVCTIIQHTFLLFPECGISRLRVVADGSSHYQLKK